MTRPSPCATACSFLIRRAPCRLLGALGLARVVLVVSWVLDVEVRVCRVQR